MYEVYVTIGRAGSATTKVEDLSDEALKKAIQDKLKEIIGPPLDRATQVLVWCDHGSVHNLIAVYDIRSQRFMPF